MILDDCFPHQVAIVQYDWPSHLREQTEKQRLIWGYKILFLDVLFPQVIVDDCEDCDASLAVAPQNHLIAADDL